MRVLTPTHPAALRWAHPSRLAARAFAALRTRWQAWRARRREQVAYRESLRQLCEMDEWQLRDLGLSHGDALGYASREMRSRVMLDGLAWGGRVRIDSERGVGR